MKKLIFMGLIVAAMCASEKEGIYDYFKENNDIPREDGTTFRENLRPSFDCSKKNLNIAESAICDSKYYSMSPLYSSNERKPLSETGEPTSIYLDNLFSSYYKLIMQHTPKDKQQELKEIARGTMRFRDSDAAECGKSRDGKVIYTGVPRDICIAESLEETYIFGINALNSFLSDNDQQKLLDSIFSKKYVESISALNDGGGYDNDDRFNTVRNLLDKLYKDNIIDETGKLIAKVDSK